MKSIYENEILQGERALYQSENITVKNCTFQNGESPLKECKHVTVDHCVFDYKYPIWYSEGIKVTDTTWNEMGRAGVWYVKDIEVSNSTIYAPKNFRRCNNLTIQNVEFKKAEETLWHCENVTLDNVKAVGDYFAMNSSNMKVSNFTLDGNYSFDGAKNIEVKNAHMMSKDAFWNSENVTVYNSYINGEYLGWNSKNLTFVDCTIDSLQGLCYIENLVLKNCKLTNTTLAFEYVTVDAEIVDRVESILNPISGKIVAKEIGTLYMEPDKIDPEKTIIVCDKIGEKLDCIVYEDESDADKNAGSQEDE